MKKKKCKRPLALLLCTILLFSQFGAAAYAEGGRPGADSLSEHEKKDSEVSAAYDISGYDPGDVSVINAMHTNNGLIVTENDPEGWKTAGIVTWDDTSSPKRIKELNVSNQNLSGSLDVHALASLTSLNCSNNIGLKSLDISHLDKLRNINVDGDSFTLFTTKNGQLTMPSSKGVTVVLRSYTIFGSDAGQAVLEAIPKEGFAFKGWTSKPVGAVEASNTLTFKLVGTVTVIPAFLSDSDAVAQAKSAVEAEHYILGQDKAQNAADPTLKTTLAGEINGLLAGGDTGVSVTSDQIEIPVADFHGAVAGTSGKPDGTDGSFKFTVTLQKGVKSDAVTKDGTITATKYGGVTDPEAVAAAKEAIEKESYTVAQDKAENAADPKLKAALAAQINPLLEAGGTGVTPVEAEKITVSDFNPAIAGTPDNHHGTDGSFKFTVPLQKGAASGTASKTGTITATPYAGETDSDVAAAAKAAVEGGTYTVEQKNAQSADDSNLKGALVSQINVLPGVVSAGVSVTAADITPITNFHAAVAGTSGNHNGTDGSFDFTVTLRKGTASATASKTGVITAEPYSGGSGGGGGGSDHSHSSDSTPSPSPAPKPEVETVTPVTVPFFTDVQQADWFYPAVKYVSGLGIMQGTGSNEFSPNDQVTRSMAVSVLWRMDGSPAQDGESLFHDVPSGDWYAQAADWAGQKKLMEGYGDGQFGPEDPVTREQLSALLYRYAEYKGWAAKGSDNLSGYSDGTSVSPWAQEAMEWAVGSGLITGSDNQLSPGQGATRAQLAQVLMQLLQEHADESGTTPPKK